MSERLLLAEELFIKENGRKPNSKKELYAFVFSKKQILSELLSNSGDKYISGTYINNRGESVNQINWYDLVADYREQIGLPKFVSLDKFNALTQLIMIGGDSIDYDSFLKLMKQKDLAKAKGIQPPKIDKLIKNQGSRLAQGIVELVSNAIDASSQGKGIGRFGEGFYQAVKFLDDEQSTLTVNTKKDSAKAYSIDLVSRNGEVNIASKSLGKYINGTEIVLKKQFDSQTVEYLISHIKETFGTNSSVNVFVNGEKINELGGYVYINGKKLETDNLPNVYIVISESGFEIIDRGVGMDSKTISEKLLYPTSSTKKKENPTGEQLDTMCKDNTKFFYRNGKEVGTKTTIRLQVAGVMIEEFHEDTIGDIKDFTFELPYFTWLPESRNEIIPTKEVVVSIKHAIEKIYYKSDNLSEKIKLIEIFGKIINKLKQRKTDETDKQYIIDIVAKNSFEILKKEIEDSGKIIVSGLSGVLDIVNPADNIVFISPDFIDFEPKQIPGIKKLKNIDRAGVTKMMDFYQVEFSDQAQYDFVVIGKNIIVNSKYTSDDDKRLILNTLVNLSVGYEATGAGVFYGRIAGDDGKFRIENDLGEIGNGKGNSSISSEIKPETKLSENLEKIIDEIGEKYGDYIECLCKNDSKNDSKVHNAREFIIGRFKIALSSSNLSLKDLSFDDCLTLILFKFHDFIIDPVRILELKDKYLNIIKNKTDKIVYSIFGIQNILFDLFGEHKISSDEYVSFMDKIIDLYDQEPEYIMQIVDRFQKDKKLFGNILNFLKGKENKKKEKPVEAKEISPKYVRNLLSQIIKDLQKKPNKDINVDELSVKLGISTKFSGYLESKLQYLFQISGSFGFGKNYISSFSLGSYSYLMDKLVGKIGESKFDEFKIRAINFYESEILGDDKNNTMFDPYKTMWLDIWKDYFPIDDDFDPDNILILAYVILEYYCQQVLIQYNLTIDNEKKYNKYDRHYLSREFNKFVNSDDDTDILEYLKVSQEGSNYLKTNLGFLFGSVDVSTSAALSCMIDTYCFYVDDLYKNISPENLEKLKREIIHIYESDILREARTLDHNFTQFGFEKAIDTYFPGFENYGFCVAQIRDIIILEHYFLKAINNNLSDDKEELSKENEEISMDSIRARIDSFMFYRAGGHIELENKDDITMEELLRELSIGSKNANFLREKLSGMLNENGTISINFIYSYHHGVSWLLNDLGYDKYKQFSTTIINAVNKYGYFGDYDVFKDILSAFFPNEEFMSRKCINYIDIVLFDYYLFKAANNDLSDEEESTEDNEKITKEQLIENSLLNPRYTKLLDFLSSDYFYDENNKEVETNYQGFSNKKLYDFLESFGIDIKFEKHYLRVILFSNYGTIKKTLVNFYGLDISGNELKEIIGYILQNNCSKETHSYLGKKYKLGYEGTNFSPQFIKALKIQQAILSQIDDEKLRKMEKVIDTHYTIKDQSNRFGQRSGIFNILDQLPGSENIIKRSPEGFAKIGNTIAIDPEALLNIILPDEYIPKDFVDGTGLVTDFRELPRSSSKYPSDLVMFVEFLMKGGEFLKSQEPKVETFATNSLKLSELMCLNRLENNAISTISDIFDINVLLSKLRGKDYKLDIYQREIFSGIEGQDRSSMIWIRELIQNSIDAINKNSSVKKVDVDFYVSGKNWTSSIFDNVGMNLFEVFNYLLVIGNSGKLAGEGVGMFGQGFFSAAIGAQEIRLKTSKGDGKCIYISLKPILNDENSIVDFDIDFDVKDEEFKGTLIERVDQSSGIMGNLKALIGVNNMQKYVGNIRGFDIDYKGDRINRSDKNKVVETMEVGDLGVIELIETDDKIERLTKDDLYCSELPEDFISDLPDWVVAFIRSKNISINLPTKIPLTKSRNSITDYEYYLGVLKPIIYRMIIGYVLKNYVEGDLKIPMLPNDFFGNDGYRPVYNQKSFDLALRYNSGEELSNGDTDYLKDKVNMMTFLLYVKFENKGKQINLIGIRKDLLEKRELNISSSMAFANVLSSNASTRDDHEKSNKGKSKYNLSIKEVSEKLNISQYKIKKFLKFLNEKFKPLIDIYFGGKFNFSFHYEQGDFTARAYRKTGFGLSLNINSYMIASYIKEYMDDELVFEALVRTVTHEMTHNLEDRDVKWGTHEEDAEHSKSFRKVQTDVLTTLLRS